MVNEIDRVKGSDDNCFKSIVASPKGKEILESILKQVLRKDVEIIEFVNTELGKLNKNEKNKRTDIIVKMDGVIANVEVNTNDYNYVKFFRNFVYLVSLFNRYCVTTNKEGKKIYDTITNIIQINLNFGITDIKTDKLILENRFGSAEGHIIRNLASYDVFIDNIKKFCYDNGNLDKYKYLLMLDMTLDELRDFYPSDEIIKEYGEALMKYSEDTFIYPYSEEEEKEMLHNTELDIAYNDGVDAGIKEGITKGTEQRNIDVIKNMLELKLPISTIAKSLNISENEIEKIIKENNIQKH